MIKNYFKIVVAALLTLLIQIYFPVVYIGEVSFSPDLVLILITYLSILYGRLNTIIMGFILGLLQDLTSHVNLIGLYALTKSVSGYLLGTIFLFESIWSVQVKRLVIFGSYFIHFLIYFYFVTNDSISIGQLILLSLLQSIVSYLIFELVNKFIFRKRIF
jgi:rod shape-determining protein MreD